MGRCTKGPGATRTATRRLASLLALEREPFLVVPDPRLTVLRDTPALFRAVRIRVVDSA
ncbi:hypothetical protein [Nonomuraea fuscirosea]|uniref:hypothetical protein n=1 Tax=Nonomuraea fuscirosea TaxID=1291556 RepID=UPI00340D268A